jgi:hypothetical protein
MKKIQFFPFNCILLIGLVLFTSCEKDKEDVGPDLNTSLPAGIEFSMHVDDKEWTARSISYVSFLTESESMGDNYVINVSAFSNEKDDLSGEGDDPNQESVHFTFSIPAAEIKNALGVYPIKKEEIDENTTAYTGIVHYNAKNHQKYMPDYSINPQSGSITLTKADFGDQGVLGELPLGEGLKSIEGTFEFTLHLVGESNKNLNITKGKFKLKTGIW